MCCTDVFGCGVNTEGWMRELPVRILLHMSEGPSGGEERPCTTARNEWSDSGQCLVHGLEATFSSHVPWWGAQTHEQYSIMGLTMQGFLYLVDINNTTGSVLGSRCQLRSFLFKWLTHPLLVLHCRPSYKKWKGLATQDYSHPLSVCSSLSLVVGIFMHVQVNLHKIIALAQSGVADLSTLC